MFTACGIMHPRCCRLVSSLPAGSIVGELDHKLYAQSSAPEDGRHYRPKYAELIGIINKPLVLHLVGCLYNCISDERSYKHQKAWPVLFNPKCFLRKCTHIMNRLILHTFRLQSVIVQQDHEALA